MSLLHLNNELTLSIAVRDRYASAKWYSDKLGFQLNFHLDDGGWSEMSTTIPGATLGFNEHAKPGQGSTIPVFAVEDVSTARASLERGGVKFDGATDIEDGMVSVATFFDPDGNALMIAQDLSN
ncbi:MAG: VOC family protein [Pseudomonadota bacterium]